MDQNVISIICDCDGTLCPDTTDKLVRELGLDSDRFWQTDVVKLVEEGWDHTLAYLNQLLELTDGRFIDPLTRSKLQAVGANVQFYPGVLDFIERIRSKLSQHPEYYEAGVTVEWYIVSSGIEEVLQASDVALLATKIFGCAFEYDAAGRVVAVKRSVTFTEKTKFVYAINKGISGGELYRRPYRVNDAMKAEDRRVPFENMVYIGDGPSDIPCFSMIRKLGGKAIGVWPPEDVELRKPYELAEGDRLTVGPYAADYQEGSDLFKMLCRIVEGIADSILEKRAQRLRAAPGH